MKNMSVTGAWVFAGGLSGTYEAQLFMAVDSWEIDTLEIRYSDGTDVMDPDCLFQEVRKVGKLTKEMQSLFDHCAELAIDYAYENYEQEKADSYGDWRRDQREIDDLHKEF